MIAVAAIIAATEPANKKRFMSPSQADLKVRTTSCSQLKPKA
jgi:hypothetical protein